VVKDVAGELVDIRAVIGEVEDICLIVERDNSSRKSREGTDSLIQKWNSDQCSLKW
jgi:hypothetical protein